MLVLLHADTRPQDARLHSCQELIQEDTEEAGDWKAPVPTLSGLDPDSKRPYAAKGYIELGETYKRPEGLF